MTQRDWSEFYLVQDELRRYTADEVDSLGLRLPPGYRELMTELGDGVIGGILRVYPPDQLAEKQEFYQELIETAWFFEEPDETLTREYARASTEIGDSADGDQVIFHPGTKQLHILPRHDQRTHRAGNDLWDVVAWFHESGVLVRPHPFRYFEPLVGPVEAANGSGTDWNRINDAVASLRLHDALETSERDRTYFVKAIGGYLRLAGSGDRVYVNIHYRTDRSPDVRARLWSAVESAGTEWGAPWLTIE